MGGGSGVVGKLHHFYKYTIMKSHHITYPILSVPFTSAPLTSKACSTAMCPSVAARWSGRQSFQPGLFREAILVGMVCVCVCVCMHEDNI